MGGIRQWSLNSELRAAPEDHRVGAKKPHSDAALLLKDHHLHLQIHLSIHDSGNSLASEVAWMHTWIYHQNTELRSCGRCELLAVLGPLPRGKGMPCSRLFQEQTHDFTERAGWNNSLNPSTSGTRRTSYTGCRIILISLQILRISYAQAKGRPSRNTAREPRY